MLGETERNYGSSPVRVLGVQIEIRTGNLLQN
jgi:hypothetical protein